MEKCKIYVVRHGESEYNLKSIVSGHVDPALTEKGIKQALATKDRLTHVKFDEVYSSDLERAYETARLIYGQPVPKEHRLAGLRERNFGALDGKPNAHFQKVLEANHETHSKLTQEEKWKHKHVPDMESDHEVSDRFIKTITLVAKDNPGKTILIAAHGGTVRTMLIALEHGTVDDFPPGSIRNASYVELSWDGNTLQVVDSEDALTDTALHT